MSYRLNFALLILLGWVGGCVTTPTHDASGTTATCYVCKYNHDLACVCVRDMDTAPKTEYQGQTYYFCSEDCKTAFLKKPEKYLPKP